MFKNEYAVNLEKDDNKTFLVTIPDFPEVTTFGKDKADAMKKAVEAIEEAIAGRINDLEDVPPAKKTGGYYVALPYQTFLKAILWHLMKEKKIRKADLARLMKAHAPTVDRLVNIRHPSKPEKIDEAFALLGKKVTHYMKVA